MSVQTKDWLQRGALIVGILSGGGALTWTSFFFSLPSRVDAQEKRLVRIEEDRKTDRELLVRIEERLKAVQQTLTPNPKTP